MSALDEINTKPIGVVAVYCQVVDGLVVDYLSDVVRAYDDDGTPLVLGRYWAHGQLIAAAESPGEGEFAGIYTEAQLTRIPRRSRLRPWTGGRFRHGKLPPLPPPT
jgi:hypothetical protein